MNVIITTLPLEITSMLLLLKNIFHIRYRAQTTDIKQYPTGKQGKLCCNETFYHCIFDKDVRLPM